MHDTSIWPILTVVMGFIAFCATIYAVKYADNLQHRKTIIVLRQDIRRVVHPQMYVEAEIVFINQKGRFSYENVFIVQTQLRNKTNKSHKNFDINVCLNKSAATVIFAQCRGFGNAHNAEIKQNVDFDQPQTVLDIDLNPFNKGDRYELTLYISCKPDQTITKDNITYDSKEFHEFRPES